MPASPDLEAAVDEAIRLGAERDYHPTIFIGMRNQYGTQEAIRRLVVPPDIQSGFQRMLDLDLAHHTLESMALRFPGEFNAGVREAAQWRIDQAAEG